MFAGSTPHYPSPQDKGPLRFQDLHPPRHIPARDSHDLAGKTPADRLAETWKEEYKIQADIRSKPIPEKEKELPLFFFGRGYEEKKKEPISTEPNDDMDFNKRIARGQQELTDFNEDDKPPTRTLREVNVNHLSGLEDPHDRHRPDPRVRFAASLLSNTIPPTTLVSGQDDAPLLPRPDTPMTITVFGFPPSATAGILDSFRAFGDIAAQEPAPPGSNWFTITYANRWQGQRALARNATLIGGWMIGVSEGQRIDNASAAASSLPKTSSRLPASAITSSSLPMAPRREAPVQDVSNQGWFTYVSDALLKW